MRQKNIYDERLENEIIKHKVTEKRRIFLQFYSQFLLSIFGLLCICLFCTPNHNFILYFLTHNENDGSYNTSLQQGFH